MTRPERVPLDLDDPEQLAEAAMLGAVDGFAVTAERLARLGRVHTELLAAQRKTADQAQQAVLELEAARAEIGGMRAINAHLRSLIMSGRLREMNGPPPIGGKEATELMLAAACALAPDRAGALGLLLSATVTGCLNAERPAAALRAGGEIFEAALLDFLRLTAPAPREEPS